MVCIPRCISYIERSKYMAFCFSATQSDSNRSSEAIADYLPSFFNNNIVCTMNIYARYFDQDTLVYSFDELMDFLSSIPDIRITPELVEDVRNYVESDMPYPKRYKIRPRVYFILIKTTAESLSAFKANRKNPQEQTTNDNEPFNKKEIRIGQLMEERKGWYKGTIIFKRVILIPETQKFQYQDTQFSALIYATCGQECYDRIIDYLKNRQDIDLRSQFPSSRGQNFRFVFMGENLPTFLSNTDESGDSSLIEQECVDRNEEGKPSEQMEMGESQEPKLD